MTSRSGNVFLLGLVILINYQCLLCYQTGPQGAVTCVHFYFSLLQVYNLGYWNLDWKLKRKILLTPRVFHPPSLVFSKPSILFCVRGGISVNVGNMFILCM